MIHKLSTRTRECELDSRFDRMRQRDIAFTKKNPQIVCDYIYLQALRKIPAKELIRKAKLLLSSKHGGSRD